MVSAAGLLALWGCGPTHTPATQSAAPPAALMTPMSQAPASVADWARGAMLFDRLGDTHRSVTTSVPEAQRYFDQGLRLMWAFNHDEATRSFAKAATLDPNCAACLWGVALTVGPNYNLPSLIEQRAKVAFDAFKSDEELVGKRELWHAVLKNTRAGIMPPGSRPRPDAKEQQILERWIKYGAFGLDPKDPDPGRVTLRRLNRIEYRNTIRDLLDVDYETDKEFPPDDTGYGFDNIGDVLSFSPLLLEKYLAAAETIVDLAWKTPAAKERFLGPSPKVGKGGKGGKVKKMLPAKRGTKR